MIVMLILFNIRWYAIYRGDLSHGHWVVSNIGMIFTVIFMWIFLIGAILGTLIGGKIINYFRDEMSRREEEDARFFMHYMAVKTGREK
jgi:hypothetical protein